MNEFLKKDKAYIWHPFTQMKGWLESDQMVITEAKGIKLIDTEGKEYYDGVSSLWVNIHGHRHPKIDQAIIDQLGKVAHSTALGLANVPASEFAQILVEVSPEGLNKVFYSDDGSTAVEVALKMAFQYWQHKGKPNKNKFIALNQSYHGDTVGSVSVGGIDLFHRVFKPLLFEPYHIPSPSCYHCQLTQKEECHMQCVEVLEKVLKEHHDKIAGLVIEPLVQAAAGMLMAPAGYLKRVRELTKKYDVLLIADEVATGFGRTGRMFACDNECVSPDLMCISKGITGGYMPLAATLTTDEIYHAFLGDMKDKKTFYHGHSYTANQLACAAGIASLEIFKEEKTIERMQEKIYLIRERLEKIGEMVHVGEARQRGMMIGIELMNDKENGVPYAWEDCMGAVVCMKAREHGLFIRPVGDVVVFMPPLCSTVEEINKMLDIIEISIHEITDLGETAQEGGGAHF
ncbi:adenosylmethionine--8-amino-7-oxononanoate transaminase [Anaerosinus gibii]|uniref:Adenosylmethionine-8-amino-7-oxononanoate aminotransferase n=1 Tax=Selenobaculum gibii TaxID=3054208 RepID=A0A9Y2AJU0_9FIRM|nr:adenosylmethionine--8-amino-7-oxononanoate transaminase [Selenobaculum gbiensis]WIW70770.1 adenosylmethionine--8-amino-7-oxononanoate transaminase [Selenobaculum gbiensis]